MHCTLLTHLHPCSLAPAASPPALLLLCSVLRQRADHRAVPGRLPLPRPRGPQEGQGHRPGAGGAELRCVGGLTARGGRDMGGPAQRRLDSDTCAPPWALGPGSRVSSRRLGSTAGACMASRLWRGLPCRERGTDRYVGRTGKGSWAALAGPPAPCHALVSLVSGLDTGVDCVCVHADLMYTQVKALKEGKSVDKPIYNHVTGKLDAPETIQSPKMLVRRSTGPGHSGGEPRGTAAWPAGLQSRAWGHGRLARLAPAQAPRRRGDTPAGRVSHITRRRHVLVPATAPAGVSVLRDSPPAECRTPRRAPWAHSRPSGAPSAQALSLGVH